MNKLESVGGIKQLKEYIKLLNDYRETLRQYQKQLQEMGATEEDQMAAVQVAMDLTYIKEELEAMKPEQERLIKEVEAVKAAMEEIAPQQKEITTQLGRIDNIIIEPIKKNYTANRNATVEKLEEVIDSTKKSSNGLKTALGFSLFLNVIGTGGLLAVILYLLGIIPF